MCVLVCLILCTGFTGSQKNALSLELEFQAVARHLKLGYFNELANALGCQASPNPRAQIFLNGTLCFRLVRHQQPTMII